MRLTFMLAIGALLGLGGAAAAAAPEAALDLVLEGGRVVDGTGAPARLADVGIRDGRIAVVGDLRESDARRRIDVRGLVVAPGFIDVHSHADEDLVDARYRAAPAMISQGVTTGVFGVDGEGDLVAFRSLKERLARDGTGVNFAAYVGHNGLRTRALGMAARAPTPAEMAAMKGDVRLAMEEGALGLSTGLMYLPGLYASTDEVAALASVVAPFGGRYDSHDRDPAFNLLPSVEEVLEIARRAGIPAHVAHLKAVGLRNFGAGEDLIRLVEAARARGEVVTADVYPYDGATTRRVAEVLVPPAGSTLEALLTQVDDPRTEESVRARLLDQIVSEWRKVLADAASREQVRNRTESPPEGIFSWAKAVGYDSFRFVRSSDPTLVGRMVAKVARERDVPVFDLLAGLLVEQGGTIKLTMGAMQEDEVRLLLRQRWVMVSSDGREGGLEGGRGHPRYRGSFARVLAEYVRRTGLLTLEEAVYKMSGLAAASLGLSDRGVLRAGAAADVVVFDPMQVQDHSTWEDPAPYATGMRHVFVNGVLALDDGRRTGALAGRFLPLTDG
jgi:N-acyl-D-aspartate/D-glutamate deacylase